MSAVRKANNFIGRSSGGLAILQRKFDEIKLYQVYFVCLIVPSSSYTRN